MLGISENSTEKEVLAAYRFLCKKYHPDITGAEWGDESYKKFLDIRDAYEMIKKGGSRVVVERRRSSTVETWYWSHKSLFQIFKRRK